MANQMTKFRRSILIVLEFNCRRVRKIYKFASHMAVSWMVTTIGLRLIIYVPLFNANWGLNSASWNQWWGFRQRWLIEGIHADSPSVSDRTSPQVSTLSLNAISKSFLNTFTPGSYYQSIRVGLHVETCHYRFIVGFWQSLWHGLGCCLLAISVMPGTLQRAGGNIRRKKNFTHSVQKLSKIKDGVVFAAAALHSLASLVHSEFSEMCSIYNYLLVYF